MISTNVKFFAICTWDWLCLVFAFVFTSLNTTLVPYKHTHTHTCSRNVTWQSSINKHKQNNATEAQLDILRRNSILTNHLLHDVYIVRVLRDSAIMWTSLKTIQVTFIFCKAVHLYFEHFNSISKLWKRKKVCFSCYCYDL